jgi:hypothetical protein
MHSKDTRRTLATTGPQGIAIAKRYSEPVNLTSSVFSGGEFGGVVVTCHAIVTDNMKGILNNDIEHDSQGLKVLQVRLSGTWAADHSEGDSRIIPLSI